MRVWPFFQYFSAYILRARTRQRLLFIAVTGLFLSAFSLMFIQGVMGGLQHGLVSRSKAIHGSHLIQFPESELESLSEIKRLLKNQGLRFFSELEVEVMLKNKNYMAPAKLHGIDLDDPLPEFLEEKDFTGLVLGSDLASRIRTHFLDVVQVISPGVTDSLMGEVPRFISGTLSDYTYTEISEVDGFEGYVRAGFVQNLIRRRAFNQVRIYGEVPRELQSKLLSSAPQGAHWKSWEDMNSALVWSLNLETKVMLFLFVSMGLLVAIAITSGLLIFYSKIRRDLMSFWILGLGQKTLVRLCFRFTLILSALTCVGGVVMGFGALLLLESFGHVIMPDIFMERQFPINLNTQIVLLSLVIPFGISFVFSWFSFQQFRKENQSFVNIVRSLS